MDKTFGKKNYENISKKHQTNDKKISTCNKRIISTRTNGLKIQDMNK